ncbi:hypothetical protein GLOTRDRAFT_130697 [Gloeophyllum trabeum ATCC 11539]|uniref:MI domain-containing protein n=1 Tax=Gloeophyllum trabeum (strain ATCC 11539 / FP-39264 / Madison 617) TaxID=670483 RepID=S7RJ52_GLOTA|nr:uncharacterized protein GLOTRDRAFT_130697 [Gloeophyllum trabeum ATCC 11539]EPQ54380.1 hypothetical protein GLOTRDRAFT_130697 [Gloeophyllum trabeum ATCC 11539]
MAGPGIRLPKQLQEQIEQAGTSHSHRTRHARPQISRKEARKQERQQRKQNRAQFFLGQSSKRQAQGPEHEDVPAAKKVRFSPSDAPVDARKSRPAVDPVLKPARKGKEKKDGNNDGRLSTTALERLASKTDRNARSVPRTPQEEQEDAYIAYLEQKLGWRKGKGKTGLYGRGFEDDGLNDLLLELDDFDSSSPDTSNKGRSTRTLESDAELLVDGDSDNEASTSGSNGDSDDKSWHGIEPAEGEDPAAEVELRHPSTEPDSDKPSHSIRYVPPHLRRSQENTQQPSEEITKLTRLLKGQLNRLTEQNISSIVDGIEEIYRKHRRHDVTSTLTKLIIDGIASHSIVLDSYVVLHAAFVASMHKIVGNEFAAYFTQTVVSSYERYYHDTLEQAQENDTETKGKECSNLIVLLSELYNFQVVSCILIYDVIRDLLSKDLTEWNVELLLKIARNSGPQLRHDDPSALKDIIQIVQGRLSGQSDNLSSRTRFMLETLINLKNNKLKTNAAPGSAETIERLKKYLSGLGKRRHVLGHEPLRITLEDLHTAESKGKWWLVGAAWNGNPLVDRLDNSTPESKLDNTESTLVKLARKQGMNTDIRRSIFVVLMSSEDYLDACERLGQLNLTEVQQREIVRVILHCCGKEKAYNPFYTLVCQQLCRTSHSYKITLQFCLWDFLRDMGESNVGGAEVIKNTGENEPGFSTGKTISNAKMQNIAKAYAWWIAKDCCPISILKPVDFTMLKLQTRTFFKEFFIQLFISSQATNPTEQVAPRDAPLTRNRAAIEQIFIRATRIEALALGLLYFLSEAFRHENEEDSRGKLVKWAVDVAKDTLNTGMDIVPNL